METNILRAQKLLKDFSEYFSDLQEDIDLIKEQMRVQENKRNG